MRRHEYELFKKGNLYGLLADCVYFCSQYDKITDEEEIAMERLLDILYKQEQEQKRFKQLDKN